MIISVGQLQMLSNWMILSTRPFFYCDKGKFLWDTCITCPSLWNQNLQIIYFQVGSLVPNSEVCLQLSLRSPASSESFLSSKFHLKVSPDGTATFPNTMDVLSRMEGKGRFYVNGPIDKNLEYTVTVEGVGSTMWKRGVYGDDVSRVEVGGGQPGQVYI